MNTGDHFPFSLRHIDLRCGSDPTQQHMTLVVKGEELPRLPIDAIVEACPKVAGMAVNLNTQGGPEVIKGRIEPVFGVREVFVESAGLALRVSPGSFFQVNLGMLPEIHSRMAEFLGEGDLLLDLYAGVGTHGLALRKNFRRVLCVEGVRIAVADTKATIKVGEVENVEVISNPIRRAIRRLQAEKPDAIILNPSAAGAEQAALDTMLASTARKVAYLSCDPETLARDLAVLIEGGFELVSAQPVDMMPQTRQVESLAFLQR
jgi:23S rRNA (uracil1939-C5)-methyltransferase